MQNRAELAQGFPPPGFHTFINTQEKNRSNSNWEEPFSYYINELGFRGNYPRTDIKNIIGFFGCSCTFGEGLPETRLFSSIVGSHRNYPILNLGMPGTGCHRIAMTFSAAANIWKIDTAIVTLPNYSRFNYVSKYNLMYSILPAHPTMPDEAETVRLDLVKHFSEEYFISAAKDAITWIVTTARQKKIKLILGSWDPHTLKIIETVTEYNPPFFNMYPIGSTPARDTIHPGTAANRMYAETLINYMDNTNYVQT
jgi:hypothetical protein